MPETRHLFGAGRTARLAEELSVSLRLGRLLRSQTCHQGEAAETWKVSCGRPETLPDHPLAATKGEGLSPTTSGPSGMPT